MEKEISSGAHLGVVLIALAAIIAIGFGVFGIAKAIANDGTSKVETTLNNVSEQEFRDYDQVVCTGTQVLSAIQNFAGKDVAVLVATQGVTDAVQGNISSFSLTNDKLKGLQADKKTFDGGETSLALGLRGIKTDGTLTTSSPVKVLCNVGYTEVEPIFINYNALLDTSETDGNIGMSEGVMKCDKGLLSDSSGTVQFNLKTAAMKKAGNAEYISNTSRFNAYTIKNATDTYIGVAFVQINTK